MGEPEGDKVAAPAEPPPPVLREEPSAATAGRADPATSVASGAEPRVDEGEVAGRGGDAEDHHDEGEGEDGDDEGHVEGNESVNHDPYYPPVVSVLPDVVQVPTGEEDEEEIFRMRSRLYRFDHADKDEAPQWKERGTGTGFTSIVLVIC